jgi:hypothetical protein
MIKAILDPGYQPMAKVVAEYQENVKKVGGVPMVIAVERNKGYISTYEMDIYADGTGHDEENYGVTERIVKTLLWLYGGYKVTVAGSKKIYERFGQVSAIRMTLCKDTPPMGGDRLKAAVTLSSHR